MYSIFLGIYRHPLKFAAEILLSYSAFWTIIESASSFFTQVNFSGIKYYSLLIITSVIVAIIRAYQKSSINLKVAHSNTLIKVFFGDIFQREGYLAIPVNEFFDSELGLPVSPKSLHGMVISRYFEGNISTFDQLVENNLLYVASEKINRSSGKNLQYKIGTTAHVSIDRCNFLFFVLSKTDINNFRSSAGLTELIHSIQGLCAKSRIVLGGEKLIIPLIGSGLSDVGLPPQHLLNFILLTLVDEIKKCRITSEIEIVLHVDYFGEIDLGSIESFWK